MNLVGRAIASPLTNIFSNRVDPKSLVYQGIYQDFDWASIALK